MTLRKLCSKLGCKRFRRWSELFEFLNSSGKGNSELKLPFPKAVASGARPIPDGFVSARQIARYLGCGVNAVLKYYLYPDETGYFSKGGPPFLEDPHKSDGRNLFMYNESYECYCTYDDAVRLVEFLKTRIRCRNV